VIEVNKSHVFYYKKMEYIKLDYCLRKSRIIYEIKQNILRISLLIRFYMFRLNMYVRRCQLGLLYRIVELCICW
jgi:hypothetical protein